MSECASPRLRIEFATLAASRYGIRSTEVARFIQKHPRSVARWISLELPKAEGVNFIHQVFQGQDTVAGRRQRRLAIDLSEADGPVKASEIRHISTRLAGAYAGKTDKTVSRDLNRLRELKLIERTKDSYRARPELMLAFLPPARMDEPDDADRMT